MPSFSDWLRASWEDYRRRLPALLGTAGAAGAATMLATAAPLLVAAVLSLGGAGPAWKVWGAAGAVAVLAALWLSTWGQAALIIAASRDQTAGASLSAAWRGTPAFAWTFTLILLAVGGGWVLLLIPGFVLSVLLSVAPFYEVAGEARGLGALGLSWGRVRPHYGRTARRMLAATVLTAAPGIVPYVGWIVMLFWAPFGAVAMARLAEDLRAAEPAPEAPGRLGGLVAALGVVLLLGCGAAIWSGVRTVRAVERDPGRYEAALMRELTPSSGQAVIATLEGRATDGQKRQAYEFMLSTATSTLAAPSAPAAPAAPAGGTP